MRLVEVYARFFRAFNHDYIRKADKRAELRPWDRLDDGTTYPFVRLEIDTDITCVVGANESGKSQLLDIIERALLRKDPAFADLCRYSPLYDVSQQQLLVPHVGAGLTVVDQDEADRLADIGVTGATAESVVRIFRRSAKGPVEVWIDESDQPLELEASSLRELLPKPFRIDPERVLPDSVPLYFLAPESEEAMQAVFRPGAVLAAVRRFSQLDSPSLADPQAAAIGKALHEAVQTNPVADEVVAQWTLARDLLVQCGGVSRAAFAEVIAAIERGDTGTAKGLQDEMNSHLASTLNLRRWWSQDEDFSLQVAVGETDVKLLITDKTNKSYSFKERSGGLKYFLSYLVQYRTQLARFEEELAPHSRVLLMDEPDAYLSSTAQGDLLRLFHDFARGRSSSDRHQVLFVTHSPFLIDKNHPERLRVLDKGTDHLGTRVIGRAHHNHFEPIRTAFGAYVAETVFIGNCNIIVEGTSDQAYIANMTSDLVRRGAPITERLDLNDVTLVAAGSADHVTYVTFLALGRDELEPPIVVLVDGDSDGLATRSEILNGLPGAKSLPPEQILTISDIDKISSDRPGGAVDIEDLIPVEVAAEACNRYAATLGLAPPELDSAAIRDLLSEDKGVFNATATALSEAGLELRIGKVAFAHNVCSILTEAQSDDESPLSDSVQRARHNFAGLVSKLAEAQRRTMTRHSRAARTRNLHGEVRRFLADHPVPNADDLTILVESIHELLDDSRESTVIKLRASEILEDLRSRAEPLDESDLHELVDQLRALPMAAQISEASTTGTSSVDQTR